MATNLLQSGTIKFPAGKTFPSKYPDQPHQSSVTVEWNGSTAEAWFDVGSDLAFLQKGDRVVFSIKPGNNGKPRAQIQLTEDLVTELQRRRSASHLLQDDEPVTVQTASPPAPGYRIPPPPASSPAWDKDLKNRINEEMGRRGKILIACYQRVTAALPDEGSQTTAQLAIALYQDLSKLF